MKHSRVNAFPSSGWLGTRAADDGQDFRPLALIRRLLSSRLWWGGDTLVCWRGEAPYTAWAGMCRSPRRVNSPPLTVWELNGRFHVEHFGRNA